MKGVIYCLALAAHICRLFIQFGNRLLYEACAYLQPYGLQRVALRTIVRAFINREVTRVWQRSVRSRQHSREFKQKWKIESFVRVCIIGRGINVSWQHGENADFPFSPRSEIKSSIACQGNGNTRNAMNYQWRRNSVIQATTLEVSVVAQSTRKQKNRHWQ